MQQHLAVGGKFDHRVVKSRSRQHPAQRAVAEYKLLTAQRTINVRQTRTFGGRQPIYLRCLPFIG
jgi:hypothetical protein